MTKPATAQLRGFGHLRFGFCSSFVIRHSTLVRVLSVPLLGGVRGGFMVPMHAKKRMGALHEPSHARPLRGLNVAYIFVAGRCGREISFKASLVWTTPVEHATVQRWYPSARQGDRK